MNIEQLEAEALMLDPIECAHLAESLLQAEIERLWAAESHRRSIEMDLDPTASRPVEDVMRDLRARLA